MKIIVTIVSDPEDGVVVTNIRWLDGVRDATPIVEALDEIANEDERSVKSVLLED